MNFSGSSGRVGTVGHCKPMMQKYPRVACFLFCAAMTSFAFRAFILWVDFEDELLAVN